MPTDIDLPSNECEFRQCEEYKHNTTRHPKINPANNLKWHDMLKRPHTAIDIIE